MKLKRILTIVSVIVAICISIIWVFGFWPISVLSSSDETEMQIINRVAPIHLIWPEWVKPDADGSILFSWIVAETKARLAVVGITWLGFIIILFWNFRKKRKTSP